MCVWKGKERNKTMIGAMQQHSCVRVKVYYWAAYDNGRHVHVQNNQEEQQQQQQHWMQCGVVSMYIQ